MGEKTNFYDKQGIVKLRDLVEQVSTSLFATINKNTLEEEYRPMEAQLVDDDGCIWFFSKKDSEKNKAIEANNEVKLFFCNPSKSIFLIANGVCEIVYDKVKIDKMWSTFLKVWFTEGKDDPTITLLKVQVNDAYYWDTEGTKMINFVKMIASVATGKTVDLGNEGSIVL